MSSTSLSKKFTIDRWRPIMSIYCTMTHHAPYPLWPRSTTHHPIATSRLVKPRTKTHSSIKNTAPWPTTHAHRTTIVDHRTITATTYDHQTIRPRPTTQNQNHSHWTHDPWPSDHKPWRPTIVEPQPSTTHNHKIRVIGGPLLLNHRREKREVRSERGKRKTNEKESLGWIKNFFFFNNLATMSCYW